MWAGVSASKLSKWYCCETCTSKARLADPYSTSRQIASATIILSCNCFSGQHDCYSFGVKSSEVMVVILVTNQRTALRFINNR
ncbi:hypothetical protein MLPF_2872 [Mycobacterium lepromatosis]|nr:hypothetical protein MLPF_2872 [Mycobacterium lepromatosis]